MQLPPTIKILFIAGFGPIVPDPAQSRALYRDLLGIQFKEEKDGYLHTESLPGVKSFALWPLAHASAWAAWGLAAVAAVQLITDVTFSVRQGDWKKVRRELLVARAQETRRG